MPARRQAVCQELLPHALTEKLSAEPVTSCRLARWSSDGAQPMGVRAHPPRKRCRARETERSCTGSRPHRAQPARPWCSTRLTMAGTPGRAGRNTCPRRSSGPPLTRSARRKPSGSSSPRTRIDIRTVNNAETAAEIANSAMIGRNSRSAGVVTMPPWLLGGQLCGKLRPRRRRSSHRS